MDKNVTGHNMDNRESLTGQQACADQMNIELPADLTTLGVWVVGQYTLPCGDFGQAGDESYGTIWMRCKVAFPDDMLIRLATTLATLFITNLYRRWRGTAKGQVKPQAVLKCFISPD